MATFLDSLMGGMQLGQQVRGLQDQGNINRLAGQAANSTGMDRTSALNQMWGVNPQMAAQQETALGASEDRRNKGMVQAARMLSGAPEAMRPGLYQQMKPMLSQYGLQLPEQYDNTVAEAANALVQAYGGVPDSTPSGLRQFQGMAGAAGLQPGSEEYQRAARVNLGLEGRASGAGYSLVKFKGPDGRERIGTMSGATGHISMPDGSTFDPRSTGIQVTAVEESVTPQGGQLDFVSDFQQFQQSGIPISSTVRTDQRNREVGGTANSYHLTGEALDIAPRNAQEKAAAQQYWQSRGYQVIDEGGHLHVEPPSRGMTTSRLGGQQQRPQQVGGAFVGRTPEEEAAAVEQARTNVQLGALPAELGMRTQAAIDQAVGIDQGKSAAEASREARQALPQIQRNASQTTRLIDELLSHPGLSVATGLSGTIDPRNYIPGSSATDFRTKLSQLQGKTFLEAFESLKGGGAITNVEGDKAEQAIAALSTAQSEEQFRRALRDLRSVVSEGLRVAQRKASGAGQQQSAAPTQQAPRARNPQTGEVVEYRNGQWVKVQ